MLFCIQHDFDLSWLLAHQLLGQFSKFAFIQHLKRFSLVLTIVALLEILAVKMFDRQRTLWNDSGPELQEAETDICIQPAASKMKKCDLTTYHLKIWLQSSATSLNQTSCQFI